MNLFQTTYETQTFKQTSSPVLNGGYNNGTGSPTFNSLPRSSTPHRQTPLYSNGSGAATSGNLSELDSLLQDLSNARYGSSIEKRCKWISLWTKWSKFFNIFSSFPALTQSSTLNGTASPSSPHVLNDTIQRPSVDSLLDELSNARSVSPVYAVPHEVVTPDGKAPKPGRHVTITVRETTTERVAGTPSPHLQSKFFKLKLKYFNEICMCDCISDRLNFVFLFNENNCLGRVFFECYIFLSIFFLLLLQKKIYRIFTNFRQKSYLWKPYLW